jgi:hypothetical protein
MREAMPPRPPTTTIRAPSPLLTVRIWQEDLGDGWVEWRGKIQDVTSGETRYFQDWYSLVLALQTMLKSYYDPRMDATLPRES